MHSCTLYCILTQYFVDYTTTLFTAHLIAARAIDYWASDRYDYQTALQTSPDLALFLILVAHCWVLVANNICQNELFAYQQGVPSAQTPA
jgi:hypothetical protein